MCRFLPNSLIRPMWGSLATKFAFVNEPKTANLRIRRALVSDAAAICEIYNHEVQFETSTFDLVPRTLETQEAWITARSGAFSAIVAVTPEDEVVGFGALSEYRDRAAYSTSVENSVYVKRDLGRRGIGRLILTTLLEQAADTGFHVVMARIEASGTASRALHESCGYTLVGIEREIGRKFGKWLDVALMQCVLHERS
ncbi:N-acetyltransferase family protein [bacterium]|nr:N-acetyltransferase family protein [bacterium]